MSNEIFFTSDCHIGHKNIIKYCNRPFDCVDDMNHTIISKWNDAVSYNTRVYCLGDICFARKDEQFREMIGQLNGKITLILGNHDNFKMVRRNKDLFEEVVPVKEIRHDGQTIVLNHYAQRTWNKSHHGSIHLYGHSHGTLPPYGYSFDVGVDSWNFAPVSWTQVKEKLKTLTPHLINNG